MISSENVPLNTQDIYVDGRVVPSDFDTKGISRRDFLNQVRNVGSLFLLNGVPRISKGSFLGFLNLGETSARPESFLVPTVVHGVEVYGLSGKIATDTQVNKIYKKVDSSFEQQHGIEIKDKYKQRTELLNPNERYLELVVRQSAYDSFNKKHKENGIDFIQWIKLHVDAMNQCATYAKPSSDIRTVLRRVLVVDDNMPNEFWDESKYRKGVGPALDVAWHLQHQDHPLDTDGSWAIADDHSIDIKKDAIPPYFLEVRHANGKIAYGKPTSAGKFEKVTEYPEGNDTHFPYKNVWLDLGMIHEWTHRLWNLPDEYRFDAYEMSGMFTSFVFATENFYNATMSPYLSMFAKINIETKKRSFEKDHRCYDYSDRPDIVQVAITNPQKQHMQIEVRRVILRDNHPAASEKALSAYPDKASQGNSVGFDDSLFVGRSNCWVLMCTLEDGKEKELYLPSAAFTMSKAADLHSATYTIELGERDEKTHTIQYVVPVDESDLDSLLSRQEKKGIKPYAKMKVTGTNTWFVWFTKQEL